MLTCFGDFGCIILDRRIIKEIDMLLVFGCLSDGSGFRWSFLLVSEFCLHRLLPFWNWRRLLSFVHFRKIAEREFAFRCLADTREADGRQFFEREICLVT